MIGPAALADAVRGALRRADLPERDAEFERPRQHAHGEYSTNVALTLARQVGRPPREIAQMIVAELGRIEGVASVDVAGPGFINFHLAHDALQEVVRRIVADGPNWGRSHRVAGARSNVEFVSANPTGPLHVGHGRQAALGEEPPEDGYHGAYVAEVAREVVQAGELDDVSEVAYHRMLAHITRTLDAMGVRFDVYFGERTLHPDGIEAALEALGEHVYRADDAVWLRATTFGDDKDRVLIRADGEPTYFAADCAYMVNKFGRGFDRLIYVLGSDHHGYVQRLMAIADALGYGRDRVEVVMHQFVNLFRAGVAVPMSKRSGEMVTFDELLDEVGADAARYTFLRYSSDVAIDFDLVAVVQADRNNPVYYVQYSHARIAGIMRTARESGLQPAPPGAVDLGLLRTDVEQELIRVLSTFPEVVAQAADERAPHRVARYVERVAEAFHRFYTECQVVGPDRELSSARYWLVEATRQTVVNGLGLLGVSAPERM